jgi:hypothetical protein
MGDDEAEGRLNAVAHPSQETPLLIRQQALSAPAPFVAVLPHCVMARLETGDEVFQAFQLGLYGGATCEQGNVRRVRHPEMNETQTLSNC